MTPTGSVLAELVPASRSLYLVFGGIAAGIGMPPFEFYRSSAILGESRDQIVAGRQRPNGISTRRGDPRRSEPSRCVAVVDPQITFNRDEKDTRL